MAWPCWPKTDEKGLARYVRPDIAGQLRLGGIVRDDLLARGHQRKLLEAIYAELLKSDIRYARELFDSTLDVQLIRDPEVILKGAGDGTCLDLALCFAGLCLGNELLSLVVVLDGHALVAVSLVDGRRDAGNPRRWDADRDGSWVEEGLLTSGETLRQLVDRGDYLAIECTGFARSEEISPTVRVHPYVFAFFYSHRPYTGASVLVEKQPGAEVFPLGGGMGSGMMAAGTCQVEGRISPMGWCMPRN